MSEATLARQPAVFALGGPALARWIALLLPIALLGGALGSQYLGGLVPCEMCWWQRSPLGVAILLAGLAFTAPPASAWSRALTLLAALAIAVSGSIGVYHGGVELGIFEGFTTCTSTASGGTTADLLKAIMKTPLVRCDQVQFAFLGISMAGWNASLSLGGAAVIAWLTFHRRSA